MSRNSNRQQVIDQSDTGTPIPENIIIPPTRKRMHVAQIVSRKEINDTTMYIVLHDNEVTAVFSHGPEIGDFNKERNVMGAFMGFGKYIKTHRTEFTTLYVTKSADDQIISAQSDEYVAEQFLRSYLDRKMAALMAEKEKELQFTNPDGSISDYGASVIDK